MPTISEWVEPEVFLEHNGVKVYHTYRDDDMSQGACEFIFTLHPQCSTETCCCTTECRYVFDVRDLDRLYRFRNMRDVIRQAIDTKVLIPPVVPVPAPVWNTHRWTVGEAGNSVEELAVKWGSDGCGMLTSSLRQSEDDLVAGTDLQDIREYNAAIDGLEALVLAQACAGVDVTSAAYGQSLRAAVAVIAREYA